MIEKKEQKNLLRRLVEAPVEEEQKITSNIEEEGRAEKKEVKKPQERQSKKVREATKKELSASASKNAGLDLEELRRELGVRRSGISRSFYLDSAVWIKLNELSETLGVSTSRIVNRALERFFENLEGEGGKKDFFKK
ncbi:MAG TPA: ribbon-helix-helix domain-containing protein [Thermodesulfobacteriota bacterium]|nr:ribbon-helix-helix domain-containing protein [Thermodesulfobacteriota bacterium]